MKRRIKRIPTETPDGEVIQYQIEEVQRVSDEDNPTVFTENIIRQEEFTMEDIDGRIAGYQRRIARLNRLKTRIAAMESANESEDEEVI